jgi:hypothetical protein
MKSIRPFIPIFIVAIVFIFLSCNQNESKTSDVEQNVIWPSTTLALPGGESFYNPKVYEYKDSEGQLKIIVVYPTHGVTISK